MYGMFDERAYLRELQKKKNLIPYEQSITDPYYASLALKDEPQITGEPDIADLNAIRSLVRADISKYIKTADQVSFAVEELDRSNDLVNFYRFHKAFDTSIKGVRGLDASFFLQLWDKFKSNVLAAKRVIPVEQPTATEINPKAYKAYYENKAKEMAGMAAEDTLLHRGFNPEGALVPLGEAPLAKKIKKSQSGVKPLIKQRRSERDLSNQINERLAMGAEDVNSRRREAVGKKVVKSQSNAKQYIKDKKTYFNLMDAINNQYRQDQLENAMAEKIQRNAVAALNNRKMRKALKALKPADKFYDAIEPPTQLPYQHIPLSTYFGFELPDQTIAASPGLPLRTMTTVRKKASGALKRTKKANKKMASEIFNDIFNETQFGPSTRARGRPLGAKTKPKPRITVGGALKKKRAKKLTKIHFV